MSLPETKRFQAQFGKKFLVTMEVNPPKGTDLSDILRAVARTEAVVDAINVTDGSGAMMRACPLAVAKAVLDAGIDPILQLTCRDRNRLALQADLLGASILGLRNLLLLTGDDPKAGDHPDAKPVFDIDSAALMRAAKGLAEGRDMAGKELKGVPAFCVGAAADPGAKDLGVELQKFSAKIAAGAQFFQTQAVFDPEAFGRFMQQAHAVGKVAGPSAIGPARSVESPATPDTSSPARMVPARSVESPATPDTSSPARMVPTRSPVLAGILLVKSAKMARYMNEHVWGIHVPDSLIERFERAADAKAECVAVASELIRAVRATADGIHLYPLGWEELVPDILANAGVAS